MATTWREKSTTKICLLPILSINGPTMMRTAALKMARVLGAMAAAMAIALASAGGMSLMVASPLSAMYFRLMASIPCLAIRPMHIRPAKEPQK